MATPSWRFDPPIWSIASFRDFQLTGRIETQNNHAFHLILNVDDDDDKKNSCFMS